jgi:soluble P-type ATPase
VLDVNGTLTDRGEPIVCATAPLQELREALTLHLLSADTFRTAEPLAASLGAQYRHITNGIDKRDYLNTLGASACAAIANGRNDAAMLKAAAPRTLTATLRP